MRELEQAGIIKRKIYAEVPSRVEYSLTRRGQKLDKVFNEMKAWGSQLHEALTPAFDESY